MKTLLRLVVLLFVLVSLFGISQRFQNQIVAAPYGCNNNDCSCGSVTECNSGYHCRNGLCKPPDDPRKGASCDLCLRSDQCDPNLGATQGCWGGYCLPCGSPDPTATSAPPPPSTSIIKGKVTSNPGAKSVVNVPVTVWNDWGQNLGTVLTNNSGNYSIEFTYRGAGNFAVRAGSGASGGAGFGSATGTGDETICTSSGRLVLHEMCPSSAVIDKASSGFDFTYNVSCTYGMTYDTLPNCSEGTYTSSVSGVSGANDVRFATWADAGGMGDDLKWYIGNNLSGGNYNYTVNSANHNPGSAGTINTDIWIGKCTSGLCPQVYCGGTRVTRACTPSPTPTFPPPFCVIEGSVGMCAGGSQNFTARAYGQGVSQTRLYSGVGGGGTVLRATGVTSASASIPITAPGVYTFFCELDSFMGTCRGTECGIQGSRTFSVLDCSPTITPTPTKAQCGGGCTFSGDCDSAPGKTCTVCSGGTCVPPPTNTPPPPPPTDFVCTGMTIENLTTQSQRGGIKDGDELRFHVSGTAPANSTISGTVTVGRWTSSVIGQVSSGGNFNLTFPQTYIAQTGTWTANATLNIQ